MDVLAQAGPPSAEMMEKDRKEILKQKEAKQAFTKLLLHIFFAIVLFCISYINRDQRGYLYKNHIDNTLFKSSKYQYGFSTITAQEHFFKWARKTLIPVYYPTENYNGDSISVRDEFFVGDMTNLRLGLIRLRQVKVKKDECFTTKLVPGHFCGKNYETDEEEKGRLCEGCSTPLSTDAWKYVRAEDIWGIPIVGIYDTYGGGGYIQSFSNKRQNTEDILDELFNLRWLDRLTRALFVEFALYNANINVICYSVFLVEFPETGGTYTWVDTQCFRPTLITSATGATSLLLNIFFIAMIIGRTVIMCKGLKKEKLHFFLNFWNILDVFIVLLSFLGVGVWVTKFIYTKVSLQMYEDDKDTFINFQHIVIWEYIFNIILGFLVFIATIRVSSALGYNKKIVELAYVLRYGFRDIAGFGVQFIIIFSAFVIFGYLMFGVALYEYRTLFISFGSLLNSIIGKNTLGKMQQTVPVIAEIYFFVYVFLVIFIMLTMFAAVLNNTIKRVRHTDKSTDEIVGILDVIAGTGKDMLGLFGIHMKNKDIETKPGFDTKRHSYGPIDTAKVVNFMKETLSDAVHDESRFSSSSTDPIGSVFSKKEGYGLKGKGEKKHPFVDGLTIQDSWNFNDERFNACTPRQIEMVLKDDGAQDRKDSHCYSF